MTRWTLAIGGSDHDFSAALMRDSDIRVAIEQERLSRRKYGLCHWYEDPVERAIAYCLDAEDIDIDDVDRVVSSDLLPLRVRHQLARIPQGLFPHHLCHAASAYMMVAPGSRAGICVYDGYGSVVGERDPRTGRETRETVSLYAFGPEGYKRLGTTVGTSYAEQDDYPTSVTNSVGMLYELVTGVLGYDPSDSGKTMGLSSYGQPRYVEDLERFIEYRQDPEDCFRCATTDPRLLKMLENILTKDSGSFGVRADLAASVQSITNKALSNAVGLLRPTEQEVILISGGCALNTVANSYVATRVAPTPVSIAPHCGDAGLAFGALWLDHLQHGEGLPRLTFRGEALTPAISRPGRKYSTSECDAAANAAYPHLVQDSSVTTAEALALEIAAGRIVGVLNGGSEIGPRALGGRSILADPRSAMVRERINRTIKRREPFRPLAPIVLEDSFDVYFERREQADPYMLKLARANERCCREAPAIVHVDGTARAQVVGDGGDPFLVRILRAFRADTGCGLLINTSFNRRGEPIVETPADAIDAFLGMQLDGLYLDGKYYRAVQDAS